MTIATLWADGAENYDDRVYPTLADISTEMANGFWAAASGIALSADNETGSYAFRMGNSVSSMRRSLLGDQTRVGVALTVKLEALPSILNTQWAVAQVRNAVNNPILTVQVTPTGRVRLLDYTGAQIAISTREVAAGVYNHFEVRVKTTGTPHAAVRVNGKTSFTVETDFAGTSEDEDSTPGVFPAALAHFGAISGSQTPMANGVTLFDDVISYSYEAADDATYIGMYGVYYLKPTADSALTQWSKSSGSSGYALINEVRPDGDTGFIFTDTNGNKSSFTVEPLPTNVVSVLAVAPTMYARKTDSGPGSVQLGVKSGTTTLYNGDDLPLLTDYGYQMVVFNQDPDTSAPWDPTHLPTIIIERTV